MVAQVHYEDEVLRRLLLDRLGRDEVGVSTHVDECDSCQTRLESLLPDDLTWEDAADLLAPEQTPKTALDGAEFSASILSFLEPSEFPGSRGRFGSYEIMDVLGRGGMGVVVLGFDARLNRNSAIKILAPELASSAAARKRFAREAKSAAAVVHPHVIPIHTVGEQNGLPYLVMPVVEGQSVEVRVREEGPLQIIEIVRIAAQVAAGLAAAHKQGMVHRDIKPANVLLADGTERVQITDFGLARAVDDASMTRSGVISGTPQYMSPEQARGNVIDCRSDLFSLGSLMYFMVSGRSPFRAETTVGVLSRIAGDTPRPPRSVNAGLPSWLETIILRLLEKNPDDRFQSAGEVARTLNGWLAHLNHPDSVPPPEQPDSRDGLPRFLRGSLFGSLSLGIATLALALTVAFAVSRPQGGQSQSQLKTNDSSESPNQSLLDAPDLQLLEAVAPSIVRVKTSSGDHRTGVIVSIQGHVLSFRHSSPGKQFDVVLPGGEDGTMTALGFSQEWQLGLYRIDGNRDWPSVEILPQMDLDVGDDCTIIGFARNKDRLYEDMPTLRHDRLIDVDKNWLLLEGKNRPALGSCVFDKTGKLLAIVSGSFSKSFFATTANVIRKLKNGLETGQNMDWVRFPPQQGTVFHSLAHPTLLSRTGMVRSKDVAGLQATDVALRPQVDFRDCANLAKQVTVRLIGDRDDSDLPNRWSGVVVTAAGHIATCAHTGQKAGDEVTVVFTNGKRAKAEVFGTNPVGDIGLVKIAGDGPWPHAQLGPSAEFTFGHEVFVGGFPAPRPINGKFQPEIRAKFVGVKLQMQQTPYIGWSPMLMVKSSMQLYGGTSGGGIFNSAGRLVAIQTSGGPGVRIEVLEKQWPHLVRPDANGKIPRFPGLR